MVEFSFDRQSHKFGYLKYTAAFLIVTLFVYGTYLVTGHSLIWRLDGANQHLPLLIEFRKCLLNFIHHPSLAALPGWSWHMGLGGDAFQVDAYYLFGDIFAYLVLLFPASKIVFAYQFLIVLRLYCAGLAFCWCAFHLKLKDSSVVIGALVYLFNAFLLYSNVAQPFFTLPFIIFPILIVNLERVIQGRSVWPLLFTFTWMLINNFYFAYILGLGAIVYLGLRLLCDLKAKKNYLKLFAKLAGATALSIINAAVLLLPEIIAVHNSTRTSSTFANGLKVYPAYYYLSLPGQLINGGNRDFYFWSALGFASIAFFAILYTLKAFKQYRIINSVLIISFIILLIPACASVFNGFLAPSNRWTLMLCLPIALACAALADNLETLSVKTIKGFTIGAILYIAYVCADYFFQNNEKIFIPVVFLFVTLGALLLIHHYQPHHARQILLGVVLLNVICNAVYFEAPFNEGYSNEMLPRKSYSRLADIQYGKLAQKLTDQTGYRISTISQNADFGAGYHMYNNQQANVNSINSYYSLQNKLIGDFAQNLQNTQFEANIPLAQFDDRTVANNFFGVKYLFVHHQQPNSAKIPAGYTLDASQMLNTYTNDRILRYRTQQNFPLMYWQSKVFTPDQYAAYGPTQKERALADGVLVNHPTGLPQASVKGQVINLPFKLISSNGNLIDSQHLKHLDSNESYKVVLDLQNLTPEQQKALKNSELHLEFESLHYQPLTLKQQITMQQTNADYHLSDGKLTQNSKLSAYQAFRNNIISGLPDQSFKIRATTPLGKEVIKQPKAQILSFYKQVKNGTMNLGFYPQIPQTIALNLNHLGTYSFNLKLVAEPLGSQYAHQVQTIQKNRLRQLKLSPNHLQGTIKTTRPGILTSSIPYSDGWQATVNGKKVPLLRTNTAFIGIKLPAGVHHVELSYHTPGLKLGIIISAIGIIITLVSGGITLVRKKKE